MNTNRIKTKDLNEASLLLCLRFSLIEIKREGSVCFFTFDEREKAIEHLEAFFQGDLKINLRNFLDSQRRIKDIIFGRTNIY